MARINGVQRADASLKIKLVYRLGPRTTLFGLALRRYVDACR